jgi:electron transfer flavoprotein alpha subunit
VAAHCGLTADCTGLALDPANGALLQTRPAFGGNLIATIRSDNFLPQLATVRPGVMKAVASRPTAEGKIIREEFLSADRANLKEILAVKEDTVGATGATGAGVQGAKLIVTGGRGMKSHEGFRKLYRLAEQLGGVVGATRAAVDAGWVPYSAQIGQTGFTVQPQVYLACGVSGQIQHLVGIQNAEKIIAINRDPEAPIMKMADIAIVGDVIAIVDKLVEQLSRN